MRVLIVGVGFVGSALGSELWRRGHEVFGLRRTPISTDISGVTPLQGDITKPETLTTLSGNYDWVINCSASGGGTAEEYRRLYVRGNTNLVDWLRTSPPRKFVYTSSTSVYGQNDGSLVTESGPAAPKAETAQALVEAERVLLNAQAKSGFPAIILRVAGIYGPGRGHWLRQFLRGEAKLDDDGGRFLNMIHVQDVVGVIIAALEKGAAGSIYNAVDDEPVSQRDLFAWLANYLKKPMPPSVPTTLESERKRGVTNKRIANARLKAELSYEFAYPTFREGFAAELARLATRGEIR
jgi:nucleoside-diphosphate-sugar epimerase